MSGDSIEDLGGGPSPEGRRGGSAGTGEFMEARATVHREDGSLDHLRFEVSALNFRRQPEAALVGALKESSVGLEDAERVEVEIGGETLTLKQTGWEIQ
jgi:hypothetical protein